MNTVGCLVVIGAFVAYMVLRHFTKAKPVPLPELNRKCLRCGRQGCTVGKEYIVSLQNYCVDIKCSLCGFHNVTGSSAYDAITQHNNNVVWGR
jgi:hypothetical protein